MRLSAARACAVFGALALLQFAPFWARGLGSYWGDLFYLHWPWRAFDAQSLQAGHLPLWNPSLYLGMPAAAAMQSSLYYPLTAPFFLFSFPAALAVFQLVHYWLAGLFCWLWLRRLGARHGAALAGGVLYAFGGVLASNQGFLNHLGVLVFWPAALALASSARLCALALTLAFFAGYPPFWGGAAAVALLSAGRRRALPAGALTALLSCVLLLPGAELVLNSRRSGGVGLDEALRFGLVPADLARWITPLLAAGPFDPAVDWWRTCYLGAAGAALVALGARALPARKALALLAGVCAVLMLMLGESAALSRFLWAALPPLKFVRYPGNLAYLAVPPLCILAAAGLGRLRGAWRAAALLVLAAELTALGWAGFKPAPRELWSRRGPLAAALQAQLKGGRYLLSPLALETHAGRDVFDWGARLYGLTNSPFRLRAAGNFGEPLVPRENYALMDRLYSSTPREAAALLPWAGVRVLLSKQPIRGTPGLDYEGENLWSAHRVGAPVMAGWLSREDGDRLPLEARAPAGMKLKPLDVERHGRDDRFSVSARTPAGWIYLAEPRFPGWKARLETELGVGETAGLAAVGPFQRVAVPAGLWTLTWSYEPASFAWGLWLSLAALGWLAASGLRALRRTA